MFDKETQLKNAPFAESGQTFTLYSAEYKGMHESEYGRNERALVVAGPDEETFVVFGVLAQQVQRMDDGDLPAQVKIGKDGRANIFEQV